MKSLALTILAACASAQKAEPAPIETPWCFRLDVDTWGAATACSETLRMCQHAQRKAITFSGLAMFSKVGECRRVP